MITIPFDPNLHLGPLSLAWHGIFTAVGIFFGVALPVRLVRGHVNEDAAYSVATWGVVGGIAGARLFHVIDRWDFYAHEPLQILAIWSGGIAVWGAVIGGVLGGYLVARRQSLPIGFTADAAAPGIGLGLVIGRIGDIINGEHHALACSDLPWCVGYSFPPEQGGLGQAGPVHPAVAYEMVWVSLGIAGALWLRKAWAGRVPDGLVFWLWMVWYGTARFLISFLRVGDPTSLLGLRQDQLIGLGAIASGIVMVAVLTLRARGWGAAATSA